MKSSWRICAHRIEVAFPQVSCVLLSHSDTVSDCSKENSHNGLHDRPARPGPARARARVEAVWPLPGYLA